MARQTLALSRHIRNCLMYLDERSQRAFLKKFRQQSGDSRQFGHTNIELIVGVFGAMAGLIPQYEPKMEGQKPDWRFFDLSGKPLFFADVVNFHMNQAIEKKMDEAEQAQRMISSWGPEELPDSRDRLLPSLKEKAAKYKALADRTGLGFVIFLYGWFEAFLHPMAVESCLRNRKFGLFKDYPHLRGVFHFDNALPVGRGREPPGYRFRYYGNSDPSRPLLSLVDGIVPLPIPEPPTRSKGTPRA